MYKYLSILFLSAPVDHILILSSDSGNSAPDSSGKTVPSCTRRLKSWPCSPVPPSSSPAQPPPAAAKKKKKHVERRKPSSKRSDDEGGDGKEKQTKRGRRIKKRKKKNKALLDKGGDSESKEDTATGVQCKEYHTVKTGIFVVFLCVYKTMKLNT